MFTEWQMEVRRILGTHGCLDFCGVFSTPGSQAAPAPFVGYIAPAPAVSYVALGPIVEYIAPAPAVYAALAPIVEYIAPAPPVSYVAPASFGEYVALPEVYAILAPIVEYSVPEPAVPTLISPPPHVSKELPPTAGQEELGSRVGVFEAGSKNGCAQVTVYHKVSLKVFAVETLADATQVLAPEINAAEKHIFAVPGFELVTMVWHLAQKEHSAARALSARFAYIRWFEVWCECR